MSLFHQGFIMHLGHRGNGCTGQSATWEDERDDEVDNGELEPLGEEDEDEGWAENEVLIVHSMGIFHHTVRWCMCSGDPPDKPMQLFQSGLFPATFTNTSTAFTFDVLDHFYIDAMECKTAAMSFMAKVRRFTNNAFPHKVLVSQAASMTDRNGIILKAW